MRMRTPREAKSQMSDSGEFPREILSVECLWPAGFPPDFISTHILCALRCSRLTGLYLAAQLGLSGHVVFIASQFIFITKAKSVWLMTQRVRHL